MMRNTILSSFAFAIVLILIRQEPCHLSVVGDTWKMEKFLLKIQKRFRRGKKFLVRQKVLPQVRTNEFESFDRQNHCCFHVYCDVRTKSALKVARLKKSK